MRILQTNEISKTYRGRKVVDDVSVWIGQGEVVGLLGPNGAGKTTSFYMIVGLISPDSGTITLDEENITSLPMFKRARRGISYLPQEPSVFRKLTVEENLLAILETLPYSSGERISRMNQLIEQLGLQTVRNNKGFALSGGERRRVEIARCVAANPRYLLLDEPFAGVDPIAVADIRHLVHDLKNRGIGVLITDHNVRETLEIVDRAYILHDGVVLKSGTTEEVVGDEMVRRVYLGQNFRIG